MSCDAPPYPLSGCTLNRSCGTNLNLIRLDRRPLYGSSIISVGSCQSRRASSDPLTTSVPYPLLRQKPRSPFHPPRVRSDSPSFRRHHRDVTHLRRPPPRRPPTSESSRTPPTSDVAHLRRHPPQNHAPRTPSTSDVTHLRPLTSDFVLLDDTHLRHHPPQTSTLNVTRPRHPTFSQSASKETFTHRLLSV